MKIFWFKIKLEKKKPERKKKKKVRAREREDCERIYIAQCFLNHKSPKPIEEEYPRMKELLSIHGPPVEGSLKQQLGTSLADSVVGKKKCRVGGNSQNINKKTNFEPAVKKLQQFFFLW